MRNDWILDVLSDLQAFARTNGMSVLAEHLRDTRMLAAAEIASGIERGRTRNDGAFAGSQRDTREPRAGLRA